MFALRTFAWDPIARFVSFGVSMQRYKHKGGDAGVVAWQDRSNGIVLRFADGSTYLYTYATPGRDHVAAMRKLAKKGRGLTTYVNQHVGSSYAMKLQ
jgi:hypothetical protein